MPINVFLSELSNDTIQDILNRYNAIKPINEPAIERLHRAEGGFQISIEDKRNTKCDPNKKIRQLRWKKKLLLPHEDHIPLTIEEERRLYLSFCDVLGDDQVLWV